MNGLLDKHEGMQVDRQTDKQGDKLECRLPGIQSELLSAVSSWKYSLCRFCVLKQEGEFDTPLLESFRNGDSAPDSTRFGFFKVICKTIVRSSNSKHWTYCF